MRIGWLTSGRDAAARTLLAEVVRRARRDGLDLDIAVVFCDHARGEQAQSDAFLDLVAELGLQAVTLSSAASRQAWRGRRGGRRRRAGREPRGGARADPAAARSLAARLPRRGRRAARPLRRRPARAGRLHADRRPRTVRPLRHAQPAPSAARRAAGRLARRHLGPARHRRPRDRRHDPPGHGRARPRPGRRLLCVPHRRAAVGRPVGRLPARTRRPRRRRAWPPPGASASRCSPRSAGRENGARSRCSTAPSPSSPWGACWCATARSSA